MKHLSEPQMAQVYFGDATEPERDHLAHCDLCRTECAKLTAVLDGMRHIEPPERAPGWESRLWSTIESDVRSELTRRTSRGGHHFWWLGPVLAALLVGAFLIGRYTRPIPPNPNLASSKGRERVLLIAMGDYLDRSQIVLAELVNAPEGKTNDISAEQKLAGELVGENRLLRQTADRSGDRSSAAVLEQLERVLLDIAHSPENVSAAELDELRSRIEAQGLLFKVRIVGSNAKAKGMKL